VAVTASNQSQTSARKRVTILGSTGSVGCNTVDIVRQRPEAFEIAALTAHTNVELLARQARELRPKLVVIADPARYAELKAALSDTNIAVAAGAEALIEAATVPSDRVIAAIVGAAGLAPTLAAVRTGTVVGIANKECLVCAGDLVTGEAERCGARLVPVDSEHSAIFQVFDFDNAEAVEKIILTASGGPFLRRERMSLARVTPAEAVAHPNWDMGAKISVDSATMMNKGLELIEAWHLFPVRGDQIDILIHPQSVVHSMVAYTDGSVLAQMGAPDMRTPISYALEWPKRGPSPATKLDLARVGTLNFEEPDERRFPALALARAALAEGGGAPTVLNAANEVAVGGFLAGQIGFLDITDVVETVLDRVPRSAVGTLADTIALDQTTRRAAETAMAALARTARAG
jgi:1-deoxy-D-xylulose-5-phosphate reductoisomerase